MLNAVQVLLNAVQVMLNVEQDMLNVAQVRDTSLSTRKEGGGGCKICWGDHIFSCTN